MVVGAMASSLLFVKPKPITADAPYKDDPKQITQITESLPPQLRRACGCESNHGSNSEPIQFKKDGSPLSHLNTNGSTDWGACMVNDAIWDSTAQKLGLNYKNSIADNYKMAKYIYDRQGINAWKWSYDSSRSKCQWEK